MAICEFVFFIKFPLNEKPLSMPGPIHALEL
jgi:hypothetical protein